MNNFLNNGKVLIGSRYDENPLKPKYVEQDPDMIAIQGWFLGLNRHAKRERLATVACYWLLAIAVVLMIFYK